MNKQLEMLLRKNKGKVMLPSYEALFIESGFKKKDLSHVNLHASDEIIEKVRALIPKFAYDSEQISGSAESFFASTLLKAVYDKYKNSDCYIYTDAHKYCGMYDVNTESAFEFAFNVALKDSQHTCFLIDKKFNYTFTLNYYDNSHNDNPGTFDIQRRMTSHKE